MAEPAPPRIYLISPPDFELSRFPALLSRLFQAHDIACLRLALATRDEDRIARAADACREAAHAADVAVVIESHLLLAERLGLDGVHLTDGARSVRKARKALGSDAIVGSFCGASRHDGMTAGEAGADYVSFGPVAASSLGDGRLAEPELFRWWSEMIEVPVVAEGGLSAETMRALAPHTDFFGIGEEIWRAGDPVAAFAELIDAMHQGLAEPAVRPGG
jgi:thiamine-phosphate pyrophosphorylase